MADWMWHMKHSPVVLLILTVLFFASGIFINFLQAVLFICVKPFNKHIFRKLIYFPNYWIYSQMVFAAEWWGDLDITLYCDQQVFDRHLGKEHGLVILNHSYEIDWLLGYVFCDRWRTAGNAKIYGKKSLQYVPVIGWSKWFGESVFLTRNWEKDKKIISRQVANLAEYTDPVMLLLMAEGTRFTLSKREKSQQFAQKQGLPILKHHLSPRTKGFTASVAALRGKFPAVYDIQLAFDNGVNDKEPTLLNILNGERITAHLYLRRVPMSELPEDEEDLNNWLHEVYRVKDNLAESFSTSSNFFTDSGVTSVPSHHLRRRYNSLIIVIVLHLLMLLPISYWLMTATWSPFSLLAVVGVLAAVSLVRSKMIAVTQISLGSQYGASTNHNKNQ